MGIDSDWARLVAEGQDDPALSRDRQLAVLIFHSRLQANALKLVSEKVDAASGKVEELTKAVDAMRKQMESDAELLAAARDTVTAAKVATRGIKWISGIVVAVAGLWWAWVTMKNGGGHDIGPGP